jgi:hypothetical protein
VKLTFKNGKVVDASAAKGQDFLFSMLDMDGGSRFLGECAIGTNYQITRYTRNTLFDEKIGGTVHFALGPAIPKPATRTSPACTGTWSSTCATAVRRDRRDEDQRRRQVHAGRVAREPMKLALTILLAILGFAPALWMLFDGTRRLIVGDYVRINGQLGPWTHAVTAAGLDPMSRVVATIFLGCGFARLFASIGYLAAPAGAGLRCF